MQRGSLARIQLDVRGAVPLAVGADLPDLTSEITLAPPTREALYRDLAT